MRVAVVGLGSIGKRHAANLRALGADVVTVDPNGQADYTDVLDIPPVDAAVIATPAQAQISAAFQCGQIPVFVEKPFGDGTSTFGSSEPVQVGLNLRFSSSLQAFRNRLRNGEAGRVRWAEVRFGQHIESWRPGRKVEDTPAVDGILLEDSHELDLALWLFGPVKRVRSAIVERLSDFPVRDDFVSADLEMESGTIVHLQLDMLTHGYTRKVTACGTRGTLTVEPFLGALAPDKALVDATYLEEMRAFLTSVETGVLDPNAATVEDAIAVHRLIAQIRGAATPVTVPA